jgi:Ran GTPase-activating protein (RanGAP) involved in mRNA processing and transport
MYQLSSLPSPSSPPEAAAVAADPAAPPLSVPPASRKKRSVRRAETVEAACAYVTDRRSTTVRFAPLLPLDEHEASMFLSLLNDNKSLQVLILEDLEVRSLHFLPNLIRKCFSIPTLQKLNIHGCSSSVILPRSFDFSSCWIRNDSLTELSLKEMHLGSLCFNQVAQLIRYSLPNLKRLLLSGNSLDYTASPGFKYLLNDYLDDIRAGKASVSYLCLDGNELGPAGAVELSKSLACNTSLQHLSLSSNGLQDEGISAIASALAKSGNLESLKVENNDIGIDGIKALHRLTADNPHIQSLSLRWNTLSHANVVYGPPLAEIATRIKVLHLDYCDLTDSVLSSICSESKPWSVTTLSLNGNLIEDDGASQLARILPSTCIEKLQLRYNLISDAGTNQILAAAHHTESLQHLELDLSTPQHEQRLEQSLRWNAVRRQRKQLLLTNKCMLPHLLAKVNDCQMLYQILQETPEVCCL